jgi:predicted nucleic acid-binding protein
VTHLIIDTSGYLVSTIARHPFHEAVRDLLGRANQPPIISPLVMAEINYLVLDKAGVDAEIDVIDDLASGAYDMPDLDLDDLRSARQLVAKHRDLKIGLTDAVNAVLAERFDTNEILTTDQRHFRAITPLSRRFAAFRLLPLDL